MEIRITTLKIHNFKGVRDAEYRFSGRNAVIEGENGTGKSTVFDAFTWLLFGKDHIGQDWTNFDIKPIDPATREPIHRLEHWVEAELTIDGTPRVFSRSFREVWRKPAGETDEVFAGHEQSFLVDGVDVGTKKAYDIIVQQYIDETIFKLITNPLYFIDDRYTNWKSRRKAILSLVPSDGAAQQALREAYADVLSQTFAGETMEDFRKRLAAAKKDNRAALAASRGQITGMNKALPEEADTAAAEEAVAEIEKQLAMMVDVIKARIAEIDFQINDRDRANADRSAALAAKNAEITRLRLEMNKRTDEAKKLALNENKAANEARMLAERAVDEWERRRDDADRTIRQLESREEDLVQERAHCAAYIEKARGEYEAERNRAFDFVPKGVCPACGQPLPQDDIEKQTERAQEAWRQSRKEALGKIVDRVTAQKKEVERIDAELARTRERKAAAEKARSEAEAGLAAAQAEAAQAPCPGAPDLAAVEQVERQTPEYRALAEKERSLEAEVQELSAAAVSTNELWLRRNKEEQEIQRLKEAAAKDEEPYKQALAIRDERDRVLRLISEEEARAARYADEIARIERLEGRAAEYVQAQIEAVEGAINGLFRQSRWKMFNATIAGGLEEMCEVTTLDGVPYRSMNDAQKILCGMDVIRVFSEAHDSYAPVFVDNAESVTRKDFGMRAQVVRLVVAAGQEITMKTE